jgi:hypothetical protein
LNIPSAAAAVTGTHKNELMLFYTLLELAVIVLAGRVGGDQRRRRLAAAGTHHDADGE